MKPTTEQVLQWALEAGIQLLTHEGISGKLNTQHEVANQLRKLAEMKREAILDTVDDVGRVARTSLSAGSAGHVRADRIVAAQKNPADMARERGFRDHMMGLPSRRYEYSKISQVSYDQGVDRAKKKRADLGGKAWIETEIHRDGAKWRWAVYREGVHAASGEAKTEKAAGEAIDDARVSLRGKE